MQTIRHKDNRGQTHIDWLKSFHSFSFGEYRDRNNMGFGPLRVINEDWVKAGAGFHTHPHANMEIITYVLSGALAHKDSLGSGGVIRPGDVQVMSAGKGILHSEFNHSDTEDVHLLQIWIMPRNGGTEPSYQQKHFSDDVFRNRLGLIVSPDGADGSLPILQDATIHAARLDAGYAVSFTANLKKKYWLQVARGTVEIAGKELEAGDALALDGEAGDYTVTARGDAEILLFELPH
jgi:redox-sensitive bicupin YhaK (pirin superfamily)